MKSEIIVLSVALISFFVVSLVFARPKSRLHSSGLFGSKKAKALIVIVTSITILCCTVPMNLAPKWNGEVPEHRDQYEKITESFLNGHLYFEYDVDEALEALDNPYSPEERIRNGVDFHWDHAYYNGHYYMYFGVVPVILAFLPFRLVTGVSLTTYHATQLFAALFIVGVFLLFYQLAKKFFPNLSLSVYLYLSVAFSVMSIWYAIAAPALYCTAIVSGLAMMIWGIYFWAKAVWGSEKRSSSIIYSTIGSLFGALTFGCRPTVALGNVIVLGMIVYYFKNKSHFKRKWIDVLVFISPYIIVGVLLAAYNYARFDSFLEFGQHYQLTGSDINNLPGLFDQSSFLSKIKLLLRYALNIVKYMFKTAEIRDFASNGTMLTFPIILYALFALENDQSRKLIKEKRIRLLVFLMVLTPFIILAADVMGSPDVLPRYRMDTNWIFGLLTFVSICLVYETKQNKRSFSSFICYCSVVTVIVCVLLFLCPYDSNFTMHYYGAIKEAIVNVIKR